MGASLLVLGDTAVPVCINPVRGLDHERAMGLGECGLVEEKGGAESWGGAYGGGLPMGGAWAGLRAGPGKFPGG
ncbi:unnamed protein product, partial [Rangifer tarandus platyrhynchus]